MMVAKPNGRSVLSTLTLINVLLNIHGNVKDILKYVGNDDNVIYVC